MVRFRIVADGKSRGSADGDAVAPFPAALSQDARQRRAVANWEKLVSGIVGADCTTQQTQSAVSQMLSKARTKNALRTNYLTNL